MTIYAVRVELAERRPTDDQLEGLVQALAEHGAAAGVAENGRLVLHLSVTADAPESVGATALGAVAAAAREVGLGDPAVLALEVRPDAELDDERTRVYAAHVELDEGAPSADQLDQLVDLLEAHGAAVGVNDYGWLTVQLDITALDLTHAAQRAQAVVLAAARTAGVTGGIVQLELLTDPRELERRAAIPPRPWVPALWSKKESADTLQVSVQQMNRYANNGRFGALKIGNEWVFPRVLIKQEAANRAASGRAQDDGRAR